MVIQIYVSNYVINLEDNDLWREAGGWIYFSDQQIVLPARKPNKLVRIN